MQVPRLFSALIDDAGLFPPTSLTPSEAITRYRSDKAIGNPTLTGRFLCRVDGLEKLIAVVDDDEQLPVGMITSLDPAIVESGVADLTGRSACRLAAVEGVLPAAATAARAIEQATEALAAVPEGIRCAIEIPLADGWQRAVDALADRSYAAKVRCGGLRADLFPSPTDLGNFIHHCVRSRVLINPTAGLHHAVRHVDRRTGWVHHGFLNVLLATCRAVEGAPVAQVVAILDLKDAQPLVSEVWAVPDDLAEAVRGALPSYGSCSTDIPLNDLRQLGFVTE